MGADLPARIGFGAILASQRHVGEARVVELDAGVDARRIDEIASVAEQGKCQPQRGRFSFNSNSFEISIDRKGLTEYQETIPGERQRIVLAAGQGGFDIACVVVIVMGVPVVVVFVVISLLSDNRARTCLEHLDRADGDLQGPFGDSFLEGDINMGWLLVSWAAVPFFIVPETQSLAQMDA